ncbi:S-adenosyl-L-methionine-dependent methyltransferase [Ascobolus immersus RN42]|uniref:S-adenosyl-L-methionine-dependent methyltransferase n=1 Tax=Ascobolus immersus RN42 TaxID=1160509 RepID=A0A3N4IE05_ASCIM|nr:S-adenosyl-L-methionine-dependent methyltransferase [Ascobolus immersus RN42]
MEGQIEIGEEDYDTSDGASLSSFGTDTTSLSPSVFDYVYENGRRYKSDRGTKGEYLLPNDEKEQERLDLTHHMYRIMLKGELFKAPIKKPKRVLDLGTGTGVWAIDFGDLFPDAEVIGTDLSPIQSTWVPPNVKFQIDDFEEDWNFEQPFDYIHARHLVGSVKDWPRFMKQIYDNLVPGGYFEIMDFDNAGGYSDDGSYEGSTIEFFAQKLAEAGEKVGCPMNVASRLDTYMTEVGFRNIKKYLYKQPFGAWPKDPHYKELGRISNVVISTSVEAYGLAALTRVLGWDIQKARELIDGAMADVLNPKMHQIAVK